jgi:hypothetical protein
MEYLFTHDALKLTSVQYIETIPADALTFRNPGNAKFLETTLKMKNLTREPVAYKVTSPHTT